MLGQRFNRSQYGLTFTEVDHESSYCHESQCSHRRADLEAAKAAGFDAAMNHQRRKMIIENVSLELVPGERLSILGQAGPTGTKVRLACA
jgi:ABC-type polysaccharide/polyol phosphate transport system ATPase subunit